MKMETPRNKIERLNFSRINSNLELPDLVEIQTSSFKWFVEEGIKDVFRDIYPISNHSGNITLDFVDCYFDKPKYSVGEAKYRDTTYSAPLKAKLRLIYNQTGEVKEQEAFMGDVPMMTPLGTFVINGAERVIVSQLVRSAGAYFNQEIDKNGRVVFEADIIPARGTWLEFDTSNKGLLNVRVDRTRRIPATVLLRALGLEKNEEILDLFGENSVLLATLEKDIVANQQEALIEIYRKLRPGEIATLDGAQNFLASKFFNRKIYDLAKSGRFKLNKKLNLLDRISERIIAEDIFDIHGELVYPKGTLITEEKLAVLKDVFEAGAHMYEIKINKALDSYNKVQYISVYTNDDCTETTRVMGTDLSIDEKHITIPDIFATFSYMLNIIDFYSGMDYSNEDRIKVLQNIGLLDDIDHLGNRRVRCVGELVQNQFRIGLTRMERVVRERMSISEIETITPQSLTNIRPLTAAVKEFFSSSQLSQFMDQTNPLAELTNKRRLSALGPGGLTRERAGFEVRDVHSSYYGRICPIETPEGPNIGLINNLSTYAKVNEYGFIETPYRRVVNGKVTDEVDYLTADIENKHVIAQANATLDENNYIVDEQVIARHRSQNIIVSKDMVDYMDVSPKQIVSVATACIPFLGNDDAARALMGANMQRQAIPLIKPYAPIVGTGIESTAARDSGSAIVAEEAGVVRYVDALKIIVDLGTEMKEYSLSKFQISNHGTCINHVPAVEVGQKVAKGDILADGPAMEKGDLALGQNVLIAFMTWNGYNYEDAIIMSERLVKEDVYTSIHIEDYEIECRDTKLGAEEITRDIPNVSEEMRKNLDERGIIRIGAEVKEGDILVGKVTPKGQTEQSAEEKLLHAIFGEKSKEVKDNSLKVPHGGAGIVHNVKILSRKKGDDLSPGVNETVKVYIVQKRKISEGDKMAGRHGNKGVISKILPVEDMPYLPDGTPVDIMLSPLGVPSRMNIGQVLELHLGMAARNLGLHVATPVFDGATNEDLVEMMSDAGMSADGKTILYDGRTGRPYDEPISVGVMYMIKLAHMVDDKLHARSVGPYSLVTQQPLGGKAQNGGQRFGEMEIWALEAYGAAHTLQEILTIKSDDVLGRVKTYEAIVKGNEIPKPGIPEAFRVLRKELQSLGIVVRTLNANGEEIDIKKIDDDRDLSEPLLEGSPEQYEDNFEKDVKLEVNDPIDDEDDSIVELEDVNLDEVSSEID